MPLVTTKQEIIGLFNRHVDKSGNCWNWTGYVRPTGYGSFTGIFTGKRKTMGAHRASYILSVGYIPKRMEIDHLCRNKKCVNPKHLEVVDRMTNQLRGNTPAAMFAHKKNCPKCGYEYHIRIKHLSTGKVEKNKRCKVCYTEYMKYYQRRRRSSLSTLLQEAVNK